MTIFISDSPFSFKFLSIFLFFFLNLVKVSMMNHDINSNRAIINESYCTFDGGEGWTNAMDLGSWEIVNSSIKDSKDGNEFETFSHFPFSKYSPKPLNNQSINEKSHFPKKEPLMQHNHAQSRMNPNAHFSPISESIPSPYQDYQHDSLYTKQMCKKITFCHPNHSDHFHYDSPEYHQSFQYSHHQFYEN